MAATLPLGTRRLPGLGEVEFDQSVLAPLPLTTSPATRLMTRSVRQAMVATRPLDNVGAADFDPLFQPLAIGIVEESGGTGDNVDTRASSNVLDEETELLDESLLDLLAQAAEPDKES